MKRWQRLAVDVELLWTLITVLLMSVVTILGSVHELRAAEILSWLSVMVSLATLFGVLTAARQFQIANRSWHLNLQMKRFDYTKQALDLYVTEIEPKIDRLDFAQFDGMIGAGNLDDELSAVEEVFLVAEWVDSDEAQLFVNEFIEVLALFNRMSGYFQYQEVYEEHLLEIVSYRVNKLLKRRGISTLISILERKTLLIKFELIFDKSSDYLMKWRLNNNARG